jgi:hypothetical protein
MALQPDEHIRWPHVRIGSWRCEISSREQKNATKESKHPAPILGCSNFRGRFESRLRREKFSHSQGQQGTKNRLDTASGVAHKADKMNGMVRF